MEIKNVTVEDLETMNLFTVQWFFNNIPIDFKVRKEFVKKWNEESNHHFALNLDASTRSRTDDEWKKLDISDRKPKCK